MARLSLSWPGSHRLVQYQRYRQDIVKMWSLNTARPVVSQLSLSLSLIFGLFEPLSLSLSLSLTQTLVIGPTVTFRCVSHFSRHSRPVQFHSKRPSLRSSISMFASLSTPIRFTIQFPFCKCLFTSPPFTIQTYQTNANKMTTFTIHLKLKLFDCDNGKKHEYILYQY
jgi:hypothetical protein